MWKGKCEKTMGLLKKILITGAFNTEFRGEV